MPYTREKILSVVDAGRVVIGAVSGVGSGRKFRLACMAALNYSGRGIPSNQKNCSGLLTALDLGVSTNDYYDCNIFDKSTYIEKRREMADQGWIKDHYYDYFQIVRNLERHRPGVGDYDGCVKYREEVNRVSLEMSVWAYFGNYYGDEFIQSQHFDVLHNVVMALQVVDDMVGWRGDTKKKRPSFFTAYGEIDPNNGEEIRNRLLKMKGLCNEYAHRASENDQVFSFPFRVVIETAKRVLPPIMEMPKVRDRFMSTRDLIEI